MIVDALKGFLSRLELTDRQQLMVQTRQNGVRARLEQSRALQIDRDFLHGSYFRETQIRPVSGLLDILSGAPALDVDCIVVLKFAPHRQMYWDNNDGGSRLLEDLRSALDGYQGITAKIDRPAVTIRWSDLQMEVTPAFYHVDGGLVIPSSSGLLWQRTDPDGDSDALSQRNKFANKELVPMIKMLKCWNRTWGKQYRSFAIEAAAFHSADHYWSDRYSFELPWFFAKLQEWAGMQLDPPSGIGGKITLPSDYQLIQNLGRFKQSIENAYRLESSGNHKEAHNIMAMVFGVPFPGAS